MHYYYLLFICSVLEIGKSLAQIRLVDDSGLVKIRTSRQNYKIYLCPNQHNSKLPCNCFPKKCPGGGRPLGVGCTNSAQCVRHYNGVSTCFKGCCCTVPNVNITTPSPSGSGFCYNGQRSNIRCSAAGQCSAGQTCMNGLCCNTTGNEYLYACGGLGALGSCSSNSATCSPSGSTCTPSNYCCECPVGRSNGFCNAGTCPSGFSCQPNGYCCNMCPGNVTPYGSCYNGQCGTGYTCQAGNICCRKMYFLQ